MLLAIFRELRPEEIPKALEIRLKVFVEEQNVPLSEEYDDNDQLARHFGVFLKKEMIGTGRLLLQDKIGRIGRIAILKEFRSMGFGARLMQTIIAKAQEQGVTEFVIGAQLQALDFYRKLGFSVEGDVFLDGGLPHRAMRLRLE